MPSWRPHSLHTGVPTTTLLEQAIKRGRHSRFGAWVLLGGSKAKASPRVDHEIQNHGLGGLCRTQLTTQRESVHETPSLGGLLALGL